VNPNLRKVALIAASFGLLVSLFVALRSGDDGAGEAHPPAAAATEPTVEEPPSPPDVRPRKPPVPFSIEIVDGAPVGGIRRQTIGLGNNVRLFVRSDVADEIHVHGYGLTAAVAPGRPGELVFAADVPGRFEIELEEQGQQIGELEVKP